MPPVIQAAEPAKFLQSPKLPMRLCECWCMRASELCWLASLMHQLMWAGV